MIKANELRIGNVTLKENKFHKVTPSDISTTASDGAIDYLYAIKLTPKILEKCGFKRYDIGETDDEYAWILPVDPNDENNYLSKFTLTDEMEYYFRDEGAGRPHSIKVESLHQLQNLYFALTVEELKVNLNHKALSPPH